MAADTAPCHFGTPSTAASGCHEQSDRTGCDGGNSSQQNKPGDENRGNQDADGVFPAGEYHRTAGSHLEFG